MGWWVILYNRRLFRYWNRFGTAFKESFHFGVQFRQPCKVLVDALEATQAATVKAKNEVERQKVLVSVARKWKNSALNDVTRLRGRVATAGTREMELLPHASATSSQIAAVTTEFC